MATSGIYARTAHTMANSIVLIECFLPYLDRITARTDGPRLKTVSPLT